MDCLKKCEDLHHRLGVELALNLSGTPESRKRAPMALSETNSASWLSEGKALHSFALKVRRCAWTGSVQGAVANWSVISMRHFPNDCCHDFTTSPPLPVRPRSKFDSPTFEAKPLFTKAVLSNSLFRELLA